MNMEPRNEGPAEEIWSILQFGEMEHRVQVKKASDKKTSEKLALMGSWLS